MSRLINRIVRDHEHVTRLLDCLDYEVAGYKESSDYTPKVSIIQEALDYLHNYSDVFHHPLKTRLMARLRPRLTEPEYRINFEQIEQQYKRLCELGARLLDTFNQVGADQVVPVNLLLSDYQEYSQLRKVQIVAEDRYLIPVVKRFLSEEELSLIEKEMKENPDPLFGAHVWVTYENLYQHIIENIREAETA